MFAHDLESRVSLTKNIANSRSRTSFFKHSPPWRSVSPFETHSIQTLIFHTLTAREMKGGLCLCMRGRVLEFLIHSAHELKVSPMVKYSALALFAERFYPSLSRFRDEKVKANWLLHPMTESKLQLFALTSLWISSKMHDSLPLSVKCLKSLTDKFIKEQHFTARDLLEAEVVLMQVLEFQIGTLNVAFVYLEELLIQLKGVAQVGKYVKLEDCLDIMDLLYEEEETLDLYNSPCSLAASVLVVDYVITVPEQRWEFPMLSWEKNDKYIL